MITQSELSQALTGVAQGAINISEGLTTIEKGSRVCQGMETLAISHRLIEAAPEMLEVLIETRDLMSRLGSPTMDGYAKVDAVITKATGKEEGR